MKLNCPFSLGSMLMLFILTSPLISLANELETAFPELNGAGVLVHYQSNIIVSKNETRSFIPASTLKLVTAWLALKHWGEDYHFQTHFYLDSAASVLWIKGSGDPFLTSEELKIISQQLSQLGLEKITAIGLDNSFFQADITAPGSDNSNNPYDATPSAIAANFNTVSLKLSHGKLVSAEKQTPLTPTAEKIASRHHIYSKSLRVNTGKLSIDAETHFVELLAYFLRQNNLTVGNKIIWGTAPKQLPFYTHSNTKSLGEMIRPMLKYSTNFIANQLILALSTDFYQRPANFGDVQTYMEMSVKDEFNWDNITLRDGAGLSRDNQLSPQQLVELLALFRPWKHLLPEVTKGIYAKSGTLNNVSALAGYSVDNDLQWHPFALMIPSPVYHKRRNAIAKSLTTIKPIQAK